MEIVILSAGMGREVKTICMYSNTLFVWLVNNSSAKPLSSKWGWDIRGRDGCVRILPVLFFMVLQVHRPFGVHIKLALTGSGKISFANRVPAGKFIELSHAMG